MTTGNPTPGDFKKQSETETQKEGQPELTIDGITEQVENLKKRVAAAQQAKQADIEKKIGEHDTMTVQLPELMKLLKTAQEAKDYYVGVKAAGELPEGEESKLNELEATVVDLENQMAVIENRINALGAQPDIFDRIHEIALKMRDGEKKGEIMSQGIENLTKENEVIIEEIKNLALELKKTEQELANATQRNEELYRHINDSLDRRRNVLDDSKHYATSMLLGRNGSMPTVEQLKERRGKLGFGHGKEKGVIDMVLRESSKDLGEYHELKNKGKVLESKIEELRRGKIEQIRQRIKENMIKAWELHEQTGIKKSYEEVDAPEKVFADLQSRIDSLGGIKFVERQIDGRPVGSKEVVNDTPDKKAMRNLWETISYLNNGRRLSFMTFSKPKLESKGEY